jgi:hypothetical protein
MRKSDYLLDRLDEVEVPDVWTDVGDRQPGPMLPPPKRTERPLVIALALVASITSLGLLISTFERQAPGGIAATTTPTGSAAPVFDGWYVSLSYQPTSVGPLAVSFGPMREAPGKAWVTHRYTITNDGNRTVTLEDTRKSMFLGPPPKTILAESGCGYWANGPHKPVHANACETVLMTRPLKPGHSVTTSITLMTGLPGMAPLTAGTYLFDQPIAYSIDGQQMVGPITARVHLIYQVALAGGVTPSVSTPASLTSPDAVPGA